MGVSLAPEVVLHFGVSTLSDPAGELLPRPLGLAAFKVIVPGSRWSFTSEFQTEGLGGLGELSPILSVMQEATAPYRAARLLIADEGALIQLCDASGQPASGGVLIVWLLGLRTPGLFSG